jgi:hypothetical protein
MKAEVIVKVNRDAAVEAILTLDALTEALYNGQPKLSKALRRRYKQARVELVHAVGFWAQCIGVDDSARI